MKGKLITVSDKKKELSMPEVNRDTMYCRTLIENKLHRLNGKECENYIKDLMCLENSNLIQLKPDGIDGDWATDLIDTVDNTLYQIYSPEYKDKDTNLASAKKKLIHDFKRSYHKWTESGYTICNWIFVLNEKLQGVYPSLLVDLNNLKTEFKLNGAKILTAKDMIDIGIKLYADVNKSDQLYSIIGKTFIEIPDSKIDGFDELSPVYLVCDALFQAMKANTSGRDQRSNTNLTEVLRKIEFNKLNALISSKILAYLDRIAMVSSTYDNMDDYTQEQVRDIIINTYQTECTCADDNNLIFINVIEKLNTFIPQNALTQIALSIIVAYHFELCDIFSRGLDL